MELDWNSFDRGVFLINCLAIVYRNGKILIGKREKDPYVKELGWTFPGGRPTYDKSLEESLKDEIRKKTNLDVEVKKLIHARIPSELNQQIILYYFAEVKSGKEEAGEKFTDIKWIKPTELVKYSTTSIDPYIIDFLRQLEKGEVKL